MDINPIHNDSDYEAAVNEIRRLWGAPEGSDDAEKLGMLATLVDHYESKRWPINELEWDAIDVLQYAIREMGHTRKELIELVGQESHASEILKRKRGLTLDMVRKIHAAWQIPLELLVREIREPVAA